MIFSNIIWCQYLYRLKWGIVLGGKRFYSHQLCDTLLKNEIKYNNIGGQSFLFFLRWVKIQKSYFWITFSFSKNEVQTMKSYNELGTNAIANYLTRFGDLRGQIEIISLLPMLNGVSLESYLLVDSIMYKI